MMRMSKYFLAAGVLLFITGMYFAVQRDLEHLSHGRCCDLKKRIAGARYQAAGLSPYFYKWQPGDPDTWCNPYESGPGLTQNVVSLPPGYLWLLQPLARQPFPTIEYFWLTLQYACILLLLAILLYYSPAHLYRALLLAGFSLFLFSKGWIVNTDIGQSYAPFPLLLTIGYCFGQHTSRRFFYAGLLLGLCCWLRPNFVLFLLPFFMGKAWKSFLYGLLLMGGLCLLQVLLTGQWQNWMDFFTASGLWVEFYNQLGAASPTEVGLGQYPASLEGQSDFSITPLPDYIANLPLALVTLTGIRLPTWIWLSLLVVVLCLMARLAWQKKATWQYTAYWFAGFCCYYAGELLVAVPKPSYYFVELLFPIGVLLSGAIPRLPVLFMYLLFGALVLATGIVKIIPMQFLLSEYAILLLLLLVMRYFATQKVKDDVMVLQSDRGLVG
jgi:hypothetical protein